MRLDHLFEDIEQSSMVIEWVRPRGREDYAVVWVDVAKLDEAWARDSNFYVGPEGRLNGIKGRYPRFDAWVREGHPVEMSEVGFDSHPSGRPFFCNGRHRYSWMRDHGAQALPVVTDPERAEEFAARYGTSLHRTVVKL